MKGCIKKRILETGFIALFLSSIIFLHPQPVLAEVKVCGDYEYQYNEEYNGIEIVKYHGSGKKVTIPETIEGLPVTVLGSQSFVNEEDVEFAFSGNASLKEIKVPRTVKVIKEGAFYQCDRLKKVELSESVLELETDAFFGCDNLREITLPKSLRIISNGAFSYCESLEKVKIPKNVIVIGESAFDNCTGLKRVIFAKNCRLEMIGERAFAACWGLTDIKIPSSVRKLGSMSFFLV